MSDTLEIPMKRRSTNRHRKATVCEPAIRHPTMQLTVPSPLDVIRVTRKRKSQDSLSQTISSPESLEHTENIKKQFGVGISTDLKNDSGEKNKTEIVTLEDDTATSKPKHVWKVSSETYWHCNVCLLLNMGEDARAGVAAAKLRRLLERKSKRPSRKMIQTWHLGLRILHADDFQRTLGLSQLSSGEAQTC